MAAAPKRAWDDTRYLPGVALEFFKVAGKPAKVPAGQAFFGENEKARPYLFMRDKMFLLLDGEVDLVARKKVIGTLKKGQIFGEMASITHAPRSAGAVAKTPCRVIALDDRQFHAGLQKKPDFALMLMSIMIGRLRETLDRLAAADALSEDAAQKERAVFDPARLAELAEGLSSDPPVHFDRGKTILQEGQSGLRMYAVLEGHVAVKIGASIVERLGPGGVFGELALIEQAPRMASAVAVTDCELLPVSRTAFLMLVKTHPDFAESLLGSLAERLRLLTAKLK
ncbi:MAG TPA: cyclic nucleotide-binding domain-containing protein [Burkholderiales bacterium]|nr:cyclic nucleotide-binding domain-containing protein [Burkholderiales bacterium]